MGVCWLRSASPWGCCAGAAVGKPGLILNKNSSNSNCSSGVDSVKRKQCQRVWMCCCSAVWPDVFLPLAEWLFFQVIKSSIKSNHLWSVFTNWMWTQGVVPLTARRGSLTREINTLSSLTFYPCNSALLPFDVYFSLQKKKKENK